MFCPKCGAKIDGNKIQNATVEAFHSGDEYYVKAKDVLVEVASDGADKEEFDNAIGLCPYCGHPITEHLNKTQIKQLNQAAHGKYHTATNQFNTGMCGVVIGTLLLLIALIFFVLCFQVNDNNRFNVNGEPFIVFVSLTIISVVSYVIGFVFLYKSIRDKRIYSTLIKAIQNKTFVQ